MYVNFILNLNSLLVILGFLILYFMIVLFFTDCVLILFILNINSAKSLSPKALHMLPMPLMLIAK